MDKKKPENLVYHEVGPKFAYFTHPSLSQTPLLKNKLRNIYDLCPICNRDEKTVEHALFICDAIRADWFGYKMRFMSHNFPRDGIANWWVSTMDPYQTPFARNENLEAWTFVM